jgi:hypothetical protein
MYQWSRGNTDITRTFYIDTFVCELLDVLIYIDVRENRRDNKVWTILRHWQHICKITAVERQIFICLLLMRFSILIIPIPLSSLSKQQKFRSIWFTLSSHINFHIITLISFFNLSGMRTFQFRIPFGKQVSF